MKKLPLTHLFGKMGGSVQTGLVVYGVCGKRQTKNVKIIYDIYKDEVPTCPKCANHALGVLSATIAGYRESCTVEKVAVEKKWQHKINSLIPQYNKYYAAALRPN